MSDPSHSLSLCARCGNQPPEGSRYCNLCGSRMGESRGGERAGAAGGRMERRSFYVDLADLHLPAKTATADARAEVVSYLYERFTPFADEGWEWLIQPLDRAFGGWVFQDNDENELIVAGAHLLCQRAVLSMSPTDRVYPVSEYRVRQLAQRSASREIAPDRARPGSQEGATR